MERSIYSAIERAVASWELRGVDVTDISLSRDECGPLYATVSGEQCCNIEATKYFGLPLRFTFRAEVWPSGHVEIARVKKEYGPDEDGNTHTYVWREDPSLRRLGYWRAALGGE